MAVSINQAVGVKGVNLDPDVRVVQTLLNGALSRYPKLGAAGVATLEVDGRAGRNTNNAITKFQQIVMGWSTSAADGTVQPGYLTWKALTGNVATRFEIVPQVTPAHMWVNGYSAFRQGDYKNEKLGNSTTGTIPRYGCALCTLTMAATSIGSPTKHWPADLEPKDLTPVKANEILRKAGAFPSGYSMVISTGASALGMGYEEHGRNSKLSDKHLDMVDAHLKSGLPIAAHVDYKGNSDGDHWILVCTSNADGTFNAIDPAYGKKMLLTSARNQTVDNARYSETKDEKTGVLFGWRNSGGSQNQQNYVVVRFGLLRPG